MKIKNLLSVALGCALLSGVSAKAIEYVDHNPAVVLINFFNPSYTGNWDLVNAGYTPSTETIDSAVATFLLNDSLGGSESYSITLDGAAFMTGGSFSTSFFGTISVGDGVTGTALVTLDSTGMLSYTLTRTTGSFQLAGATLTAQASPRPGSQNGDTVPDGGATLAMLGMGMSLLGFYGIRRKSA